MFFTPETLLLTKKWKELLMSPIYVKCLRAIVVDEAHTVKKWGETFRNILLRIGEVRSLVPPTVYILTLTATATKTVQQEVSSILGMKSPSIVAVSQCKPNVTSTVTA